MSDRERMRILATSLQLACAMVRQLALRCGLNLRRSLVQNGGKQKTFAEVLEQWEAVAVDVTGDGLQVEAQHLHTPPASEPGHN